MELKEGYKQTEVGVIPEDWEEPTVGSICKLINGRGFKPHEWRSSGLPIIRIQNLNGSEDFNYYDGSYDRKLEVEHGQLLFAWSGSRGTSFGPHIWVGSLGLLNYHTWKVQVSENEISSPFFLHALKQLTKFIEDNAHGASALVHTQKWEMEGFKFACPPTKDEQEAIAEALSDADALIESLEQLIAKKRQLKQGAMQELLTGKKRLPGFSGEWEVKTIGSIADTDPENLGTQTRSDYLFKYISLEDVDQGTLKSFSDQKFAAAPSRARRVVRQSDVLVSTVRPNLKSHLHFREEKQDWVCSTGFCLVRCRKGVSNSEYIFAHMFADPVNTQIDTLLTGSNYPAINSADVGALEVPLPSYAEQTAIAEILSDMDAEIAALDTKLGKARQVKQGMMQDLLTGKIRLIQREGLHA
jgi:restriction endonuclease S subunit